MDDAGPSEFINITPDAAVRKRIIREGQGEVPAIHARCLGGLLAFTDMQSAIRRSTQHSVGGTCLLATMPPNSCLNQRPMRIATRILTTSLAPSVHYVGTIQGSGEVFMDTRNEGEGGEPARLVAGRGELRPHQ